jgi:hypothetical protein
MLVLPKALTMRVIVWILTEVGNVVPFDLNMEPDEYQIPMSPCLFEMLNTKFDLTNYSGVRYVSS